MRQKKSQHQIKEDQAHKRMFEKFNGLSKRDRVFEKAKLHLNPIKFTYSINGDQYIREIIDFRRNGRTLIYDYHGEEAIMTWDEKRGRYRTKYAFIYFSFLETHRVREI